MKKFSWKFIIIILAVIVVIALLLKAGKKKTETTEEIFVSPVQVAEVGLGTIKDYHKFGGTVTSRDTVAVLPDTSGKIVEIYVRAGDKVEKDQILGKLDASRAGQNFNLSAIKAPISGTVTQVSGVVGSMAAPSSPFAIIQTLDDLEISFNVIERYVTMVTENSPATVSFDAFEGEIFDAYISHVNPTLDVMTRTLAVKAKLKKDDSRVRAGMFARLEVTTQVKDNVIVVPYSAITIAGDSAYAFVVNGDVAQKVNVVTGIREGDIVEITNGLKVGDKLVVNGQGLLSDGQSVRIID